MSDTQGNQLTSSIEPNLSFSQIPANIQVPGNYIEIDADTSNVGLLPYPARILAIGHMSTSNGTATAGQLYQNINSPAQAASLFGAATPAADMITALLNSSGGSIPIDAIGEASAPSPVAATGLIAFSGGATSVGAQAFGLAGNRVAFTISPGDTVTTMAANFIAAAQAYSALTPLPFSFATTSTAGQVKITALFSGIFGNFYDIRANPAQSDITVPGVGIAVTAMSGGAGTPVISSLLSSVATIRYTDVVVGWNDAVSQAAVGTYLATQSNAMTELDGVGYTCWTGTQGQIAALVVSLDSQFTCGIGITNPQNPPWVIAATLCGVAAFNLMNDPARQLRGIVLPGIIKPAPADEITTWQEQNALLLDGVGTYMGVPGGAIAIQRLVTNYTTSPLGVPDQSWQDIMSVKVMSRIRWDWKNYLNLTYPNYKLADDGSLAAEYNANVVTPRILKGAWAARSKLYEQVGWIENSQANASAAVFVRDPSQRNKVNSKLPVQVIGNLMITAQSLLFEAGI